MELKLTPTRYRALPAHVIEYADGAIVKRGALETQVHGERAVESLQRVLEAARDGATRDELREPFSEIDRPAVDYLLDQLIARRVLVAIEEGQAAPTEETPESIFYWEFNQDAAAVRARLRDVRLAIVGVNEISRQLLPVLRQSGFEQCDVVDYPLFRNLRLFGPDGTVDREAWPGAAPLTLDDWQERADEATPGCVVATCDHGGLHWMRHWNQVCVANRLDFFPVVLQRLIGYIGPYMVPGETACFECLRARQNSHLSRPDEERVSELLAFDTQAIDGFHPAMPGALAHVAALELVKVCSRMLPYRRVASLIEMNPLIPTLTTRKVLRIPNCTVCRTIEPYAAMSTGKADSFMPGNRR